MRILRRFLYPLRLAAARLARRGERVALVAVGVAAGSAMLAAALAGGTVAQDSSLARATGRIPPQDRSLRAIWAGVPVPGQDSFPTLDRAARDALRPLGGRPPFATMIYRESEVARRLIVLAGIEQLGRWVRLRSGRVPRRCRPERCEVLQLAGSGSIPSVPGLRLVRVGRGTLTSAVPLGTFLSAASSGSVLSSALTYHRAPSPPFLVAEGVQGLASSPPLAPSYRNYAWVRPLTPGSAHPWSVDGFAAAVERARSTLAARTSLFDITAPIDELQAAEASGRVAGRRLLLIGGEAAALLLAFAVLAAASLRRDVDAAWRRLTWYGGRRWQLVLLTATETASVALLGTLVGWAVGTGVSAVVAGRADSPVWPVLTHSVLSGTGLAVACALAGAAALVVLVSLRARPLLAGEVSVGVLDVAALGALAAIGLALARGVATDETLASQQGTGVLLLLLPALVAFVAAVAFARLLAPLLRLLGTAGARAPVPLRLATLSLARRPGRTALAASFLVVSLALALFAAVYRSTLVRAQSAEASYAVPADFVLSEDLTKLVSVVDAAPWQQYRRLGRAVPVLRLSGNVPRLVGSPGFTLLGLPAEEVRRVEGWRDDFAPVSRGELARRLGKPRPLALTGIRLPARATELALPVSTSGDDLRLSASIQTTRGDFVVVRLGETAGPRRVLLRGPLPERARGGTLVGFTFVQTGTGLHGVANGGANVTPTARGVLTLGRLRPAAIDFGRWVGGDGVRALGPGRLRYLVPSGVNARFRARQVTDGQPVPVIVTRRLARAASPHGVLPLDLEGQRLLARVAGTVERFPSVRGDVALADAGTLATALNAEAPGAAGVDEVWVHAPDPRRAEAALRRPPLDSLLVSSQASLERRLRSDPLAHGTLLVLAAAAIVALALALVGLLLGVVADLRDERGELFDLEAQGATPARLRSHVRLRVALVTAAALLGGLAAGAILTLLVVRLVTLTAEATAPEPPLALSVDWPLVGLALLAYAAAAAVVVAAATRSAFHAASPGRFTETA